MGIDHVILVESTGTHVASSPVPLFSRTRRTLRGEEKRRAWYPLFAHVQDFHGIP